MYRETLRRTGLTTKQIQTAPEGAVFIWPAGDLSYPRALAAQLGRKDLRIEPQSFLENGRHAGLRLHVVLDHAFGCVYSPARHRSALDDLKARGLLID